MQLRKNGNTCGEVGLNIYELLSLDKRLVTMCISTALLEGRLLSLTILVLLGPTMCVFLCLSPCLCLFVCICVSEQLKHVA